jgi:lipoyl(octanoyl) transferase
VYFPDIFTMKNQALSIHYLGRKPYIEVWQAMRDFTEQRQADTPDQLWVVEHDPVFTQGLAGLPEHIITHSAIPLVQTDRGGQVTYHGPGQLIIYPLLNFKRLGLGVRALVCALENAVIDTLAAYQIIAHGDRDAPGVYVEGRKIASIGLRIKNNSIYHGISFNIDMDLQPYQLINPCGYPGLAVTQLTDFGIHTTPTAIAPTVIHHLMHHLSAHKAAAVIAP